MEIDTEKGCLFGQLNHQRMELIGKEMEENKSTLKEIMKHLQAQQLIIILLALFSGGNLTVSIFEVIKSFFTK